MALSCDEVKFSRGDRSATCLPNTGYEMCRVEAVHLLVGGRFGSHSRRRQANHRRQSGKILLLNFYQDTTDPVELRFGSCVAQITKGLENCRYGSEQVRRRRWAKRSSA